MIDHSLNNHANPSITAAATTATQSTTDSVDLPMDNSTRSMTPLSDSIRSNASNGSQQLVIDALTEKLSRMHAENLEITDMVN